MKRFWTVILLIVSSIFISSAEAKTVKMVAQLQKPFSTQNPSKEISFKVIGDYELKTGKHIPSGLLLNGEIIKIKEPKRGKLNAVAYFKLKNYTMPDTGKNYIVKNQNAIGKVTNYKPLDLKDKSLDLGASAAGLLVEHISYPINFVRGAVTAQEGENRLKAGAEMTYEKSMFSYFSKGKHIDVPAGGEVIVTFEYQVE